ncbi:nucleotidyltransferase family protein [Prochlorococcus marinus]|jgi:dTDP-glucose pyrophosphorylase|uniref:Nucleoside-diphosphate-sugar pyrophosphorylase n=1 Tax=Prochlorococcus marinus (strain MIT 9301) TaxID=167546 RepID=A3PE53_PROM0|nr:nucleotidyltransferase family protein [Prochlorococcus marinus]ABO18028.1 Nucleoside-diphosphate-sugar pyrophosphorylase [Prochlorococcus marinus str. MIT 9301]
MKRNFFIKNCRDFSVNIKDNVGEAIQKINKGGFQICLVFNEQNYLEGIITDSDLRRGILNGVSKSSKLSDVINYQPIKVHEFLSEEKIYRLMIKNHIFHIPLVDENNKFKGIFVSNNLIEESFINETFFILAGGKGLRMRPLTKNLPKPMLHISGKPMIELIINNAKEFGFRNFVLSIGYLGEVIKEYFGNGDKFGINISYIQEEKPLGTAGSLAYLKKDLLTDYVFITNGDVVTSLEYSNMLNFAKYTKADGVIAVKEFGLQNPFGVIETSNDNFIGISEKPIYKSTINAGVYVVSKNLIGLIEKGKHIDMNQLFELGINKKKILKVFALHEEWTDVGRPEDYKRIRNSSKANEI